MIKNNISHETNGNKIIILGKSAHGSTPECGVNAALITLEVLGKVYSCEKLLKLAKSLTDTRGKSFGCFAQTKLMGETTFCVGKIDYEKGVLNFSVNFRYPETVKYQEYVDKFDDFFSTKSKVGHESKPLFFDPDSALVKTLMEAYRKESHDLVNQPMTIGGGTYAKHCKNTVAFGALFPGREYVMHQPDEYMLVDDIVKSACIYAQAIYLLGKLK